MIQFLLSHDAVQLRPMLFFSDETYFPVVSWASRLNWLFTQYFFSSNLILIQLAHSLAPAILAVG